MEIFIQVKQPGRKQPVLDKLRITIEDLSSPASLQQVVEAIVTQQVKAYNDKPLEKNLLPFLQKSEIDQQAQTGKVGFGAIYNEKKADLEQAKHNALQSFEDGIIAVFVNDNQLTSLDEFIDLSDHPTFTFIRLTFLAGSFW